MNLVLPDITGALGVSFDEGSWLLTVYSCALFLAVPVSIWAAGYVGHKRFLLGSPPDSLAALFFSGMPRSASRACA